MKKLIIILLWISSLFLFAQEYEYKIIESKTELELNLSEFAEKTLQYDVIFFGELHDDELLHHLEFELLKEMHSRYPRLIVSMEMFERDVQTEVDDFLAGKINEEEFILSARAWSNYRLDYKPIVDYVKTHNMKLIAANIPRRYAAMINQNGEKALDSLTVEEKKFVAQKRKIYDDEYKQRFIDVMEKNVKHIPNNPMGMKMNMANLYAAQCIKDDTMAEAIWKIQRIPPRRKVLHFNGDFHSRKHLGTAQKLKLLEPMLHIAVIAPVVVNTELEYSSEDLEEGDFLIIMKDKNNE